MLICIYSPVALVGYGLSGHVHNTSINANEEIPFLGEKKWNDISPIFLFLHSKSDFYLYRNDMQMNLIRLFFASSIYFTFLAYKYFKAKSFCV